MSSLYISYSELGNELPKGGIVAFGYVNLVRCITRVLGCIP